MSLSRRSFVQKSMAAGLGLAALPASLQAMDLRKSKMKFGLVTYQWGRDWDLPTLIANCEKAGVLGVELRTQHAHGVETSLSPAEREAVKLRFADSQVTCIGYGSNYEYHSPDAEVLRKNIEETKAYLKLCQDIGATGIKVKPNTLPEGVPAEKTITQIAASFNEVGKYAADLGQLVRVEVHGHLTQELPTMKAIFEQVTEPAVKICWNCNAEDLLPPGLEANFHSVKKWFGDTVHVREFDEGDYPYPELFKLFNAINYEGWILMEARTAPADRVKALEEQKRIFHKLTN
ncbi:sugar phosphate isomerase/epimerase [Algoriphagus halophytocola]|uniref:Sugar phosphate isomerase/epimerase n=1 Tax=Algoriphagus halophytocola TaxID=2991499 RepID=A0ABY6MI03_9BACT|nr:MULTISPECIES: sugar phosphate isomerase/epimerase family protein [unclassified Algoriphagus]UZD23420.1 sugar phosphate isomerase/epimerase [Algoriphagus sp. TR-M5]WBL44715.1 sugar phosphate isomerase/epimerase [Algoriphagus sp. TR-M9]